MCEKSYIVIDGIKYDEKRIKQLQQIEDNSKLVIDSVESILDQLIMNGDNIEQSTMNVIWGCWKLCDGYQKEFLEKNKWGGHKMKEITYIVVGEIMVTKCPYGKKHGVGLDPIMVGSDQCWNCSSFKGVHGLEDTRSIYCNYEDTHVTKK